MKSNQEQIELTIRLATIDDLMAVFLLANEETVRVNSFHSEKIELEKHKKWFTGKIADHDSTFLIAEANGQFAGQIRFDLENNQALVGISLSPAMRGKGVATEMLRQGVGYLKRHSSQVNRIDAYIKPSNQASIKLFERSGFVFKKKTEENGCEALVYSLII
jgi:RimJ/RimL family protein N-acetyltransferase